MIPTILLIALIAAWELPAAEPQSSTVPIYQAQINLVSRTIPAVNYTRQGGSTRVDFRGTGLLPGAEGEARVDSRQGATRIDARFEGLRPATAFGPEYLTYVLWAITPEGRPENLGEVVAEDDGDGKLQATTSLQAFGLLVTAEPYFAVTRPSDVVVMENVVREDTSGQVRSVTARYELLPRDVYIADRSRFEPVNIGQGGPLQLSQAENAVRIARQAGADRLAGDTWMAALRDLQNARRYWEMGSHNERAVVSLARAATQTAEDARMVAMRRVEADRQAAQRAAAEQARQEAERQAAEAERAETERAAAERARREAEASAQRAEADRDAAQAEAARARAEASRAQAERDEMRRRLVERLNSILETRETARGVIVSIGDVLFDFDRATLKQTARESLAKVAGVLLAYPGLTLRVEGHTDNVGTADYNLKLSQERADAVRNYLIRQGIPTERITAVGFGPDQPVASNETPEGRRQNRRVELVVTGESIGFPDTPAGQPTPPM